MTMTTKTAAIFLLFLALLLPVACAQDANGMTPQELQQRIEQLETQVAGQAAASAIPIIIKPDAEYKQQLDMLVTELKSLKEAVGRMEERFSTLATETKRAIDDSEARAKLQTAALVNDETMRLLEIQDKNFKDYVSQATNPLRMNLPSIGVFCMLTAALLLWVSRQYRLTEGVRNNGRKK